MFSFFYLRSILNILICTSKGLIIIETFIKLPAVYHTRITHYFTIESQVPRSNWFLAHTTRVLRPALEHWAGPGFLRSSACSDPHCTTTMNG